MIYVIRIFSSRPYEDDAELRYIKVFNANVEIDNLNEKLNLYDFYQSELVISNGIAFYDITVFDDSYKEKIKILKRIRNASKVEKNHVTGKYIWLNTYHPDEDDGIVYNSKKQLIYKKSSYECGASGYETIIAWVTNNPIPMIFIGGALYDVIKYCISKFISIFIKKNKNIVEKKSPIICIKHEEILKTFSKMIKVSEKRMAIVELRPIKNKQVVLKIRTIDNDLYRLTVTKQSEIVSYSKVQ